MMFNAVSFRDEFYQTYQAVQQNSLVWLYLMQKLTVRKKTPATMTFKSMSCACLGSLAITTTNFILSINYLNAQEVKASSQHVRRL
jgi:hypothetical protein